MRGQSRSTDSASSDRCTCARQCPQRSLHLLPSGRVLRQLQFSGMQRCRQQCESHLRQSAGCMATAAQCTSVRCICSRRGKRHAHCTCAAPAGHLRTTSGTRVVQAFTTMLDAAAISLAERNPAAMTMATCPLLRPAELEF